MSAYIVDTATIDAIVHAAITDRYRRGTSATDADALGEMLLRANVASVAYRYPDSGADDLPGRTDCEWASEYRFPFAEAMTRWPAPSPAFALKQLACLEYQSCERPDWKESEAYAAIEAIRASLIARLPGYDAAPWGVASYPVRAAVSA